MDTVHECDRQTDGQTDGLTDRITITDTVQRIASHGKNGNIIKTEMKTFKTYRNRNVRDENEKTQMMCTC